MAPCAPSAKFPPAGLIAPIAAALILWAAPAGAETCLLDRNGDGTVQANDGDGDASSSLNDRNAGSADDTILACGLTAAARGGGSTALGYNAQAGLVDQALQRITGGATAVGANAIAHGNFGTALGYGARAGSYSPESGVPDVSLALGYSAVSTALGGSAIGAEARAAGNHAVAIGAGSGAWAADALALGRTALANGVQSIAMAPGAQANGANAMAIGAFAQALGHDALAIGRGSSANAVQALALVQGAQAAAINAIAVGAQSRALAVESMALGSAAQAAGTNALAIGRAARAQSVDSLALGPAALANGTNALAIGPSAMAMGEGAVAIGGDSSADANAEGARAATYAVAIGTDSRAYGLSSQAIGSFSAATGSYAQALGFNAFATRVDSLAIGTRAVADHAGSTAIGQRARTTRANQIMLGGPGTSVALGDLTASDAAQVGPEFVLTIDANGTIGRASLASAALAAAPGAELLAGAGALPLAMPAEMSARLDALDGRLGLMGAQLAGFDLRLAGLEGGIAAAMALGGVAPVPGKRVTVSVAAASYGGEQAIAGQVSGWLGHSVLLSAGVSGNSGDGRVGARVAASFGF